MIGYKAILAARFRVLLQYRAAAIAGLATQIFWGFLRIMLFDAFYRSTTRAQPMQKAEVVDYIWLGQALFALLPLSVESDLRVMIKSGAVAYELLRPLDLYTLWYVRTLAARTAPTLLRAIPLATLAFLFFGLRPPPSFASGLAWIAAMLGAVLLVCAFATLITVSLLWTISGEGITRMMPLVAYLFSGMLLPLVFFPSWAQPLLNFLPFRDLVDTPFRLYAGHIPASQAGWVLAHEFAWTLALIAAGRMALTRAMRRMVVQGG